MWQLSPRPEQLIFLDRTNNSLFALAAQGHGLLLTGGDLHLIQLRALARFLSGTPGCSVPKAVFSAAHHLIANPTRLCGHAVTTTIGAESSRLRAETQYAIRCL